MATIGGANILNPTSGATVTVTIDPQIKDHIAAWTATENENVVISGTPVDGQRLTLLITNDATLARIITLSTGLSANGTIVGVASKKSTWMGTASGGVFYETSRVVGVLT